MKRKTITVHDPDLGPIELPDEPPMSAEAANRLRERIRRQLQRRPVYQAGIRYPCTVCRRNSAEYATDLTAELHQGNRMLVFRNLRGVRCARCGAEYLEAAEQIRIEDEAELLTRPVEPARVSRIGRGTLGTYWPKPIERSLHLKPGTRLDVKILGPSSALLHVRRAGRAAATPTRTRNGRAP